MGQKSVTFNLIMNGIKTLMSVLFPLITFPYASRVLGADGIGKVNYASSIISYFSLIAALGINTYAVREGARIREDQEKFQKFAKEIFHINIFTTGIAYLLLLIFFGLPILREYKFLLVIFSIGIVFTTIGMEWLFTIEEEYAYITKRAVLFQFISLILLFLLVKEKEDYYWYAALTVISAGGSALMNFWHSKKFVNWKEKIAHYEYRKHLRPIIIIFGTSIATSLYMTMDTTMLGALKGDTAVGIYTAATKINLVINTLIGTISATILPRVSFYIGNGKRQEYEGLMKASMDVLLMLAIPAAIGMICTSDVSILLFSGKEFLGGVTAANILAVKVVVGAINRVLAYQVCIPYKKDKEVLISTVCGAVFNLFANLLFINWIGVTGAAIATLMSEIVVFIVLTGYSKKIVNTKKFYTRCPVYLGASVGFFFIRWCVNQITVSTVLCLIMTVFICVCIYFLLLLLVKDPYLTVYKEKIFRRICR